MAAPLLMFKRLDLRLYVYFAPYPEMFASHFLTARLYSKVCGNIPPNLKIISRQALFSAYSFSTMLTRPLPFPVSHSNAGLHDQCLHPSKFSQSKSIYPGSAAYSSSKIIESQSEPSLKESVAKPKYNMMTNPFKKERTSIQTLFRDIIARKGDTDWTSDEWTQLVESLPLTSRSMWEVICMHTLYLDKNISVARRLMMYLESQTKTPSLIALTFYIGLLGETSNGCEDQDNETFRYYQLLLSHTDVLDAASIEVLISGLSMTKHYLECLKLLDICLETSIQSPNSLIKLLRAGLRNKDLQTCRFALTEFEENKEPSAFNAFVPVIVEECLSVSNQDGLEMVMNFIQKHHLLLQETVLEDISEIFNRYQPNQWTAKYGFIHHKSGKCNVCGHQMKKSEVNDADFKAIQSAFLEQVIVGRNVFFKSTPDEVNSFITFVKKAGPFDVVIDGLNVVYRGAHQVKKRQCLQLEKAVEYYSSRGEKILILGSLMLNGYLTSIKKMMPKPAIYMTTTSKADDAFFLYAALHSGKNTLVVSSDKLRDHKFLLDPSLRHIFHQWALTAQVYDWRISPSGQFGPGRRHLYLLGPEQCEGGWHIPMMDVDYPNPFGKFSVLCLRSNDKQATYLKADTVSRSSTEKLTQVIPRHSHVNCTRAADDYTSPDESQTKTTVSHTKKAGKGQKCKNLATQIKIGSSEMQKKFDTKVQQSKTSKLKDKKDWFDS